MHTHSSEHTHTHAHPEQWAANAVAPGEQLGVRCLAQGTHLSHGIEGGESARPMLYPLGHDCPFCLCTHAIVIYYAHMNDERMSVNMPLLVLCKT